MTIITTPVLVTTSPLGLGDVLSGARRHCLVSEGCQLSGEEHAMMFKIHFVYNNPLAADTQHNHNLKAEMWSAFEMLTLSRPVMMTHLWEFDEQLSDSETLPSADNHHMRHIAPPGLWSQHPDVLTTPMMMVTVKTFTADAMCQSGLRRTSREKCTQNLKLGI